MISGNAIATGGANTKRGHIPHDESRMRSGPLGCPQRMIPPSSGIAALAMLVLCTFAAVPAAETAAPKYSGQWVVISDSILAELGKTRSEPKDPYARQTAGIAVDRTNGDVYLMANNIGICKSTDQGESFTLVSGNAVTGRFETGFGINIDPAGGRLMCFSIYGSSAYSADAGRTWTPSKTGHLDYGAVDWADTGKALLAIGHESGGKLMFSPDAGREWKTLGTNYWAVGLFDHQTLMASLAKKSGILRSTDGGTTWNKVSDEKPAAPVMVELDGIGYWLGERGLLVSHDKGASWTLIAPLPKGACLGPMCGRTANDLVVGSPDGLYQSKDGGLTWDFAVPLAPAIKIQPGAKWATYGWDPTHNIFYASQMIQPAYKFVAK